MHTDLLKEKLFQQSQVLQALKNGDTSSVEYSGYRDKEWGIQDANYVNRMRLAYYLLYAHMDDEDTIVYLFQEELKDRKTNSFQGIGNSLNVLTFLLNRYNANGKYDQLLEEAKNANFDCACGFDKNYQMDDEINSLDLMDCIFLSQDLSYKDVMEQLVNSWKDSLTEWRDANRTTLTRFYSFLGKEQENETLYKELLNNAVESGETFNIVSAYNKVIQYYIEIKEFESAYSYLREMIDITDFEEIERIRLFSAVLEESFEIICGGVREYLGLWEWAKPYLQKKAKYENMYGNLYTKGIAAAKAVNDTYAIPLEKEYVTWRKKMQLE